MNKRKLASTVLQHLNTQGPRTWTKEEREKLRDCLKNGMKRAEICETLGRSYYQIHNEIGRGGGMKNYCPYDMEKHRALDRRNKITLREKLVSLVPSKPKNNKYEDTPLLKFIEDQKDIPETEPYQNRFQRLISKKENNAEEDITFKNEFITTTCRFHKNTHEKLKRLQKKRRTQTKKNCTLATIIREIIESYPEDEEIFNLAKTETLPQVMPSLATDNSQLSDKVTSLEMIMDIMVDKINELEKKLQAQNS